jgi:hypothetical protein
MAHWSEETERQPKRSRYDRSNVTQDKPAWAELCIVGYEAKLFDDPVLVQRIESGEFLIPWRDQLSNPILVDR